MVRPPSQFIEILFSLLFAELVQCVTIVSAYYNRRLYVAVSIPHGEYQVFDCLSTLLLRLAAATIYESLGMTRLSCHQLSKDVIIFILMVAISAGVCEFDFLFAVRLIYIERGHC